MENYKQLTIDAVQDGLTAGTFSAKELAQEALRVAEAENEHYGAFLHFSPQQAIAAAENVDKGSCGG